MSDQTTTQSTRKHSPPVAAVLATADLLISLMLMTRRNERTVQPTKRVTFSDNIKKGLAQFQEYRCMFCGVRRKLPSFQIDHVNPVVRGGSNETSNLQLTLRALQPAKGDADQRGVLQPGTRAPLRGIKPGRPPASGSPSPQGKFKSIETKKTRAGHEVRKFKKAKYISPQTKIKSGSLAAGAACGAGWFLAWNLSFTEPSSLVTDISVFGGIASGLLTSAGLILRAKVTGRYLQN